jgi:hypothetical protein
MVFLSLSACDYLPQQKYKPTNIKAMPSATESGMMWGGDKAKIIASIDSVVMECIPVERTNDDSSKFKGSGGSAYEIAATANISYSIIDKKFFKNASTFSNIEPKVIFEAITSNGVVIGQASGSIRIIENGSTAKASTKIYGLTLEEIKRIAKVEARWEYGR